LRAAGEEIELYIALDKQMVIKAILGESSTQTGLNKPTLVMKSQMFLPTQSLVIAIFNHVETLYGIKNDGEVCILDFGKAKVE
jgi:hypothetical protein